MAPRLLIFDLGGVFVDFDAVTPLTALTAGRSSADEVRERFTRSSLLTGLERGDIGIDEYARGMLREMALDVTPEAFLENFKTWDRGLFPGARELIRSLRERHTIACLTNNNEVHWASLCERHGLDTLFHHSFISCRLKLVKPDVRIYTTALSLAGVAARDAVFFDDNPANVAGAKKAGITAYCVRGIGELGTALHRIGIS